MAKNIDNEREALDRINGRIQERASKIGEQFRESLTKAAEAAEKKRKEKLAREVARCILAVAGIGGLFVAEWFGLISPVLTAPVYAIAFVYIGWHSCKISGLRGRK